MTFSHEGREGHQGHSQELNPGRSLVSIVSFVMTLTKDDTQPPFEYACHEGNYAMTGGLAGAREQEKTSQ